MDTEQLGAWEWVRGSVCADACEGMALVRCPRQAVCRFATLRLPSLPFAPPRHTLAPKLKHADARVTKYFTNVFVFVILAKEWKITTLGFYFLG